MPTSFEQLKNALYEQNRLCDQQRHKVFITGEALKKLERQEAELLRTESASEAHKALKERKKQLLTELTKGKSRLAQMLASENGARKEFADRIDPRQDISHCSDKYPLLLFPVRLETRFKKIGPPDNLQYQLWVRVFPDECSIDTFEPTLTETETQKARAYWIKRWQIGQSNEVLFPLQSPLVQPFINEQLKIAWRELASTGKPGRAYWTIQHYKPVNDLQLPRRSRSEEVILVIPTEELPKQEEQQLLKGYWGAIWLDNYNRIKQAGNTLIARVGKERAQLLIQTYVPVNLGEQVPKIASPTFQVAFVHFPASAAHQTRQQSWSQAPRVTTFPECFVLTGVKNNQTVFSVLGKSIPDPLIVGPDPSENSEEVLRETYEKQENGESNTPFEALQGEAKAALYVEYLSQKADTRWLFDFDQAVENGLGFKVILTPEQYQAGFDRLLVAGVKLSLDEKEGKEALEQLLQHHHFGTNGLALVPQGTPTNNTETGGSGHTGKSDPDQSFERYHGGGRAREAATQFDKPDGRWLAEFLGIDATKSSLLQAEQFDRTDQRDARAMNTALWPATIGYYLESLLTSVLDEGQRATIRWYFLNHVRGQGRLPAIRIGNQPYGILPTAAIARFRWLSPGAARPFNGYSARLPLLQQVHQLLQQVRQDWMGLQSDIAHVGQSGDGDRLLLKVLGLQASSQEFYQRYSQGFSQLAIYLQWLHPGLGHFAYGSAHYQSFPHLNLLRHLGYSRDVASQDLPILKKVFSDEAAQRTGPIIDENPLSETQPIHAGTDDGKNYIEWLGERARTNPDDIRLQVGFTNNQVPPALLYEYLRHALNLAFFDTALRFFRKAGLLKKEHEELARMDPNWIGFKTEQSLNPGKWEILFRPEKRITGGDGTVADYIAVQLNAGQSEETADTRDLLQALDALAKVPTARLERVFAEHLDCCTYRLDAWLLGLVNLQLYGMRYGDEPESATPIRQGLYLGAYGWVENLRPDDRTLTPVELPDELDQIFNTGAARSLVKDDTNAGYIHAPSLNQAVTAAVLRNAYLSYASPEQPDSYRVNLSSERVRMAMNLVDGLQQGQSLGALLGYQLERDLHDRFLEEEVDFIIYELRKAFPLVSNRLPSTVEETDTLESISLIEARNVIDGLALANHIQKTGITLYPFGKVLKQATPGQQAAIEKAVGRMLGSSDALADLATAESVHQTIQGNYDRAAGTLDAYSKGAYPPIAEVVQTPRSGVTLTHRVGIHLPATARPTDQASPRVLAEPALNEWLSGLLPPAADIGCQVRYQAPPDATGAVGLVSERWVSLEQLELAPIDLLYTLGRAEDQQLTALDDQILQILHATESIRPDAVIDIQYTRPVAGKVTFFELVPLVSSLQSLLITARPLRPSDLQLPTKASANLDQLVINPDRIRQPLNRMKSLLASQDSNEGLINLNSRLSAELMVLSSSLAVYPAVDNLLAVFARQLKAVSAFGNSQAGYGFVYERRKGIVTSLINKLMTYLTRWEDKRTTYEQFVQVDYERAASEEQRLAILQKAERTISLSYTQPLPATAAQFRAELATGKEAAFRSKLADLKALLEPPFTLSVSTLVQGLRQLKSTAPRLNQFDLIELDSTDEEQQIRLLLEDMLRQAQKLQKDLASRISQVEKLLGNALASANSSQAVELLSKAAKVLFGEDFAVYPVTTLGTEQANELANCLRGSQQLLAYQRKEAAADFPVDDWLYGVARVREKMGLWENIVILAESLQAAANLPLTPLQLPYQLGDSWLALAYPKGTVIDRDKLLYTAHLTGFDPAEPFSGILLDEWTEVIPADQATTGLSFQYDRPNNEPPQSLLLVTPTEFTGSWKWGDLIDALHETLDLARLRAIEPALLDPTPYAQFLPATVSTVTAKPATIALNFVAPPNKTSN